MRSGDRCAVWAALLAGCTFGSSGASGGGSGLAEGSSGSASDTGATATAAELPSSSADGGASGSGDTSPITTAGGSEGPVASTGVEDTSGGGGSSSSTGEMGGPELCDGIDNDGDGGIDEGSPINPACGDCTFLLAASGQHWFAICDGAQTWDEARTSCADFGPSADLAIIDDPVDQAVLLAAIAGDWWIGMSDERTEGHWRWVDGTDAIVDGNVIGYDGWAAGQPEDITGENCGELDSGQSGWADTPCESLQPRICRHPT